MRDQLKVIIGFGCIWGVFAFGGILLSSFTLGANDTAPEVLALVLYGLTTLPACIMAIWHRRASGFWLIALSVLTAFGMSYQVIVQSGNGVPGMMSVGSVAWMTVFISIPLILGVSLLRSGPIEETEGVRG